MGWRQAAEAIHLEAALSDAIDLDQGEYEALHDGVTPETLIAREPAPTRSAFEIDRIGATEDAHFQDVGIAYYRFVIAA